MVARATQAPGGLTESWGSTPSRDTMEHIKNRSVIDLSRIRYPYLELYRRNMKQTNHLHSKLNRPNCVVWMVFNWLAGHMPLSFTSYFHQIKQNRRTWKNSHALLLLSEYEMRHVKGDATIAVIRWDFKLICVLFSKIQSTHGLGLNEVKISLLFSRWNSTVIILISVCNWLKLLKDMCLGLI